MYSLVQTYVLEWSELTPEAEYDGSGFITPTGNIAATVSLYPEGTDPDAVDPIDSETITLHDERETTTPDVWDAAVERLLTRNGLTQDEVLKTITPW